MAKPRQEVPPAAKRGGKIRSIAEIAKYLNADPAKVAIAVQHLAVARSAVETSPGQWADLGPGFAGRFQLKEAVPPGNAGDSRNACRLPAPSSHPPPPTRRSSPFLTP